MIYYRFSYSEIKKGSDILPEIVNKDEMAEERYWKVSSGNGAIVVRAKAEAEAQEMARLRHLEMFPTGVTKIEEINEMTYIAAKVTELENSVRHVNDTFAMVACLLIFTIVSTLIAVFLL